MANLFLFSCHFCQIDKKTPLKTIVANLFIFVATFINPIKKHPVQFKTFLFNQITDEICPSGAESGVLSRWLCFLFVFICSHLFHNCELSSIKLKFTTIHSCRLNFNLVTYEFIDCQSLSWMDIGPIWRRGFYKSILDSSNRYCVRQWSFFN